MLVSGYASTLISRDNDGIRLDHEANLPKNQPLGDDGAALIRYD